MNILFLTHYFPPEVNAPATRTCENARRWVRAGHRVTVLTCAPNHPNGVLYPGYKNRLWQWGEWEGITVLRVMTYLSANKGSFGRIANYLSYLVSAVFFAVLAGRADVVVSTSPQFFCGLAGAFVSALKKAPWVLEIRDLWPESIATVEAISSPRVIGVLEKIETWMYRHADMIVSVTDSFVQHFLDRGITGEKVAVVKNGADLDAFSPQDRENDFRRKHGLSGKFVASYVGTHGMAHGLDTVLKAAEILRNEPDIIFMLVGDGAERENLKRLKDSLGLPNVLMLPQLEKTLMPQVLAASDVSLVHLRKADLFKSVIPSKIFESMAMERPIILGVEGESRGIVEAARCGICIEPGNAGEMAEAVRRLRQDRGLAEKLGKNGKSYVAEHFDRNKLADRYLSLLKQFEPALAVNRTYPSPNYSGGEH